MEYVLIFLAVICFVGQFAFTKIYEGTVKQTTQSALIMLTATGVVGAILFFVIGGFRISFSPVTVTWAAVFALIMIPYYTVGIRVLSLGSLAIYSMFMMLGGMLVPFFYGILLLDEDISISKLIGTVLLTLFIILQAVAQRSADNPKREGSSKGRGVFFALCILIFFINGMTGVVAKAHQISSGAVNEISFTVISCALTAIFGVAILLLSAIRQKNAVTDAAKRVMHAKPMLIMALIGITAHSGNLLHLIAAADVPASVQFPIVSGGVIVLSALVSVTVFKERVTCKEWVSIVGAFLSTVLFAF
jgi:drug/metabolite transporter (DMT)-like permease